jgi:hypothetical protein
MSSKNQIRVKIIPHASLCGAIGETSPNKKYKISDEERRKVILQELENAFDNERNVQTIILSLSREKEKLDGKESERWTKECNKLLTASGQIQMTDKNGEVVSPQYYYEEYLKTYLGTKFVKYIEIMWNYGIFDIYKPDERPFVLYSCQKDIHKDFHPEIEKIIPLKDSIDYGIIFKDIHTYMPRELEQMSAFKDTKPVTYCLFHSLFSGFNFAFAVFRSLDGRFAFRFGIFDRLLMDCDDSTKDCRL